MSGMEQLPTAPRPQVEPLSAYLRRTGGWLDRGRDWTVIADAVARLERVYEAAVTVVTIDELGHFNPAATVAAKALDKLSKTVRGSGDEG